MSGDPFAGLSDSPQDRRQRDGAARKQRWVAFWASLGAALVVAVAAGVGGACGGWLLGPKPGNVLVPLLAGAGGGLAGGVFFFLAALWHVMRQVVVGEVTGREDDTDIGATLFRAAILGAAVGGVLGAALGHAGEGPIGSGVAGGAVAGVLLAMIPVYRLSGYTRRTSRTRAGNSGYRKPD